MNAEKASVLVFGSGRSSLVLLEYLSKNAPSWSSGVEVVGLAFSTEVMALQNDFLRVHERDAFAIENNRLYQDAKLVISMLPASLHPRIAKNCLEYSCHFLSASYVSTEMRSFSNEAEIKGLLFLNECGLDPGLDHMSAMDLIKKIENTGGVINSFESFAGGLMAPGCDDNPWKYKLTWNPRNVVLAGQGAAAKFRQAGTEKYIPYDQLFKRTEIIEIPNYGKFEGYANRNSLNYEGIYGLQNVATLYRGTLRKVGFSKAWDKLIQLGLTEDHYKIAGLKGKTFREFTNLFLAYHPADRVEVKFERVLGIAQNDFDLREKFEFLGLFSSEIIPFDEASPAEVLQFIVEKKWKMEESDRDMVVMWHRFEYEQEGRMKTIESSLVVEGTDPKRTAMAKTVGLPIGIAAKLICTDELELRGVQIPTDASIYRPILNTLALDFDIRFNEIG